MFDGKNNPIQGLCWWILWYVSFYKNHRLVWAHPQVRDGGEHDLWQCVFGAWENISSTEAIMKSNSINL